MHKGYSQASKDRGAKDRLGEANGCNGVGEELDSLSVGVLDKLRVVEVVPGVRVARESKDCNEGGPNLHNKKQTVSKHNEQQDRQAVVQYFSPVRRGRPGRSGIQHEK
jgi:hypothetical protein